MSKITLDNLSDNLKDLIGKNGITEEQIIQIVEENISGDLDLLNTNEKGSLVAAINELFQSANNGKELIANAIGEPLDSNDTFSAMSNDINVLLSTFKNNMRNNGVTVESTDKFKQLIDKIATMVEGGSSDVGLYVPIPENTNVCIYYDVNATFYGGTPSSAEGGNLIEGFEMPLSGTVRFETVMLCTGNSGAKLYYYINDNLYSTDDCTTSNTPTMTIPTTGIWYALASSYDDMQAYLIQKELTVKKGDIIRVFADNSSPSYNYGFSLYTATLRCSFEENSEPEILYPFITGLDVDGMSVEALIENANSGHAITTKTTFESDSYDAIGVYSTINSTTTGGIRAHYLVKIDEMVNFNDINSVNVRFKANMPKTSYSVSVKLVVYDSMYNATSWNYLMPNPLVFESSNKTSTVEFTTLTLDTSSVTGNHYFGIEYLIISGNA